MLISFHPSIFNCITVNFKKPPLVSLFITKQKIYDMKFFQGIIIIQTPPDIFPHFLIDNCARSMLPMVMKKKIKIRQLPNHPQGV